MDFDFGDLPTWLAAVGAGIAVYFAYAAYKIESARDHRQIDVLRRQQASRVAIWAEQLDNPRTGMPDEIECFRIRNASGLPVYNVRVFAYKHQWQTPETVASWAWFDLRTVPPADEPVRYFVGDFEKDSFAYALDFNDSTGESWHRDRSGQLREGLLDSGGFKKMSLADPNDLY